MSEWRKIAEWDWVLVDDGDDDHLHAVASLANPDTIDTDWYGEGMTECGRAGVLSIPGILDRTNCTRCPECCEKTGMPQGSQSPKNVPECRAVVAARLNVLAAA